MTGRGRPLRFLALVFSTWILVRIAVLWGETGSPSEAIKRSTPFAPRSVEPIASAVSPPLVQPERKKIAIRLSITRGVPSSTRAAIVAPTPPFANPARVERALISLLRFGPSIATGPSDAPASGLWIPDRPPPLDRGWSASAWLVARPGTGLGVAPGAGQLGGSQAGVRVAYVLVARQRLAATARVTTPLRGAGREASIGVEWQPTKLPIRLVAEHRVGLDGTVGGPGAGVIAGVDAALADFRLEGYGQAGALRRVRMEPYADGAIRLSRTLHDRAGLRLELGLGAWGAAQRGVKRLDVGPSIVAILPIAGHPIRISLDWRQRLAGSARPGSGPALSVGSNF